MARPCINLDESRIVELASNGNTIREIAAILGVSESLIGHRYRALCEKGRDICCARIRSKQVERALAGSDTMLIWLGKQMLGQSDKLDHTTGGYSLFADAPVQSQRQSSGIEGSVN